MSCITYHDLNRIGLTEFKFVPYFNLCWIVNSVSTWAKLSKQTLANQVARQSNPILLLLLYRLTRKTQ